MINPSQHKPTGIPSRAEDDAERQRRLAWIDKARKMHRNKRLIGLAGIILGAALVFWGRSTADAPSWALTAGFAVLGVSWVLFIYVIVDRWRWVKRNPYRPGEPPVS